MLRSQAKTMDGLENHFLSLAHPYKISSHLIHGDETGIGIIAERNHRSEVDKEIIEISHFCSLISHCLNYFIVCGYSFCIAFTKNPEPFHNILKDMKNFFSTIDALQAKVYEDPVYDKFKGI
jgi:hypothetical protein